MLIGPPRQQRRRIDRPKCEISIRGIQRTEVRIIGDVEELANYALDKAWADTLEALRAMKERGTPDSLKDDTVSR